MPVTTPTLGTPIDPVVSLEALLLHWRVRPGRNLAWVRDLEHKWKKHGPTSYLRYRRVSFFGTSLARLLDLAPVNQSTIRVCAFFMTLIRAHHSPTVTVADKSLLIQEWDEAVNSSSWLRICLPVLHEFFGTSSQLPSLKDRHKQPTLEAAILAIADKFDTLTSPEGSAPGLRAQEALHALKYVHNQTLDPRLIDMLWGESGQALCNNALRRRSSLGRLNEEAILASIRLLQEEAFAFKPARLPVTNVEATDHAVESEPASTPSDGQDVQDTNEGSTSMSNSSGEEPNMSRQHRNGEPSSVAHLGEQLLAVKCDLEEISGIVNRSLEKLASVAPAIGELSAIVSRLQESLLGLRLPPMRPAADTGEQGAPAEPARAEGNVVAIRVERANGLPLDIGRVWGALEDIRDIRDLSTQQQETSWVSMRAQTDPNVDLTILEAKVSGALARQFAGTEDGPVDVTLAPAEAA